MLAAQTYQAQRSQLLRAAAWNAYVSRRGVNADAGRAKRRENQRAMIELRQMRLVETPPASGRIDSPRVILTIALSFRERLAGKFWRVELQDVEGPGTRAAWHEMPGDLRAKLEARGYDAGRLHDRMLAELRAMNDRGLGVAIAGVGIWLESA